MSLFAPQLQSALVSDGFRIPNAAGTTFNAGDIVVVGASLVGQAAYDYNWQGSTGSVNALNAVGVVKVPWLKSETIAAGAKVGWNLPNTASTYSYATAVATSSGSTVSQYPLGVCVKATTATTGTTYVDSTDSGLPAIIVLMWPGTGIGN